MIQIMISTRDEICTDMAMYNPFVGGYKVVVEIINITESMLDFGNGGFTR